MLTILLIAIKIILFQTLRLLYSIKRSIFGSNIKLYLFIYLLTKVFPKIFLPKSLIVISEDFSAKSLKIFQAPNSPSTRLLTCRATTVSISTSEQTRIERLKLSQNEIAQLSSRYPQVVKHPVFLLAFYVLFTTSLFS